MGGSWSKLAGRAEVPTSVPALWGEEGSEGSVGGSGNFLVVYTCGLRNANFYSEKNY